MSRYATYYPTAVDARMAAIDKMNAIREDWVTNIITVDRFSEYNVLPYQRHMIKSGEHLAAVIVETSGEIAKDGEDPIGHVTVRHTYAYPAGNSHASPWPNPSRNHFS